MTLKETLKRVRTRARKRLANETRFWQSRIQNERDVRERAEAESAKARHQRDAALQATRDFWHLLEDEHSFVMLRGPRGVCIAMTARNMIARGDTPAEAMRALIAELNANKWGEKD